MEHKMIESLLTAKTVPMDEETTELFLKCVLAEKALQKENKLRRFGYKEAEDVGLIGEILYSRLHEADGPLISFPLGLFIVHLANGNPAKAVLWAYTLFKMNKGKIMLTFTDLSEFFPIGFPSESEFERVWDSQKGHLHGEKCDNMLDNEEIWT